MSEELETRVTVLEIEHKNTQESIKDLKVTVDAHRKVTDEIKERLDKQNGAIPHMAESVKLIAETQQELMAKLNKNEINDVKQNEKVKLLWKVGGIFGAAILGYVLKSLLG